MSEAATHIDRSPQYDQVREHRHLDGEVCWCQSANDTPTETDDHRDGAKNVALLHTVYRDLLAFMPMASYEQTERFMANLALYRRACKGLAYGYQREAIRREIFRFLDLRVTPGDGETSYKGMTRREIETYLNRQYGELLKYVPGFYANGQDTDVAYSVNLPARCVLFGYRDLLGYIVGILCVPFDKIDTYFLLSSRRYNGPPAKPLSPKDRDYFEQYALEPSTI